MMKEVRLLTDKATASLLLAIDHFNRVHDTGRTEAVLLLLNHSLEMHLKAGILSKGGKIREARDSNTINFNKCVRKALSDQCFIDEGQALLLQAINGLRNAAHHHLLDLSEGELYFYAQAGVGLAGELLKALFAIPLIKILPSRVLPLSTQAARDPVLLFSDDIEQVRGLLGPGRRKRAEAQAKLRGLAILDNALQGRLIQPSSGDLNRLGRLILDGGQLSDVFPGIGGVDFTSEGSGSLLNLRIAAKEGIPVTLVPEGTEGAGVVAVRKINELDFYNLGRNELAKKINLSTAKTTAAIVLLGLKVNPDYAKEIRIGKFRTFRYSQKAIIRIKELVKEKGEDRIWEEYKSLKPE